MPSDTRRPGADLGAFDAAAEDALLLAPHLWDPVAAGTLALTRPQPGERVLDACCGTGPSALPAAHAVGDRGRVDAVDLSRPAAELALREAERSRGVLPQLRVHAADVTTWQPDGYDLVQCVLGAFFFPDPEAGTEHLVRRARPGGRVAVTVWRSGALRTAGQALLDAVAAVRGELLAVPQASGVAERLGHAETLASWFTGRGVADVVVTKVPHAVRAEPVPLWSLVLGSGFRGLLAGLPAADVDRVRERYLAATASGAPLDATSLVALGRRPGEGEES